MICPNCGKTIEDGATVCTECGSVISPLGTAAAPAQAAAQPVVTVPAVMPKNVKEYVKTVGDKKLGKEINGAAIVLYICAALTTIVGFASGISPLNFIIDVVLLVACGIWLHLSYKRLPAILALAYGIVNTIVVTITNHQFGGYLILIAGIIAVIYTFKAKKEYDAYKKSLGQ